MGSIDNADLDPLLIANLSLGRLLEIWVSGRG